MALQFKLVSEFVPLGIRAFELVTPAILNPLNVNPLVMGEFLELAGYKMQRGSGDSEVPTACYYQSQGSYDVQGLGKGPFLFMGPYEADTKIMNPTDLAENMALMVTDVDMGGGILKRGLAKWTATHHIIGYVTRLPADNNGYLRFRRND